MRHVLSEYPSNAEYSVAQLRMMLAEVADIVGREVSAEEWAELWVGPNAQEAAVALPVF